MSSMPPLGCVDKTEPSTAPTAAAANKYTHHRPARSLTTRRTIGIPAINENMVIRIPYPRKMPIKFTGDLDKGHRIQASANTALAISDDLSKALINAPSMGPEAGPP